MWNEMAAVFLSALLPLATLHTRELAELETYYSQLTRPLNESSLAAKIGSSVTARVVVFFIDGSTEERVPLIDVHVGRHSASDYWSTELRSPINPQPDWPVASKLDAPFVYTVGLGSGEVGEFGVVQGWDAASIGIRAGERRLITVPAAEGYWSTGYPSYLDLGRRFPRVPKDATLVVDLTCDEVACQRPECREPLPMPPPPPMIRGSSGPTPYDRFPAAYGRAGTDAVGLSGAVV